MTRNNNGGYVVYKKCIVVIKLYVTQENQLKYIIITEQF